MTDPTQLYDVTDEEVNAATASFAALLRCFVVDDIEHGIEQVAAQLDAHAALHGGDVVLPDDATARPLVRWMFLRMEGAVKVGLELAKLAAGDQDLTDVIDEAERLAIIDRSQ